MSDLLIERGAIPTPIRRVRFGGAASSRGRPLHDSRDITSAGRECSPSSGDYTMTEEEIAEYEKQEKEEETRRKKKNPLSTASRPPRFRPPRIPAPHLARHRSFRQQFAQRLVQERMHSAPAPAPPVAPARSGVAPGADAASPARGCGLRYPRPAENIQIQRARPARHHSPASQRLLDLLQRVQHPLQRHPSPSPPPPRR